MANVTDRQITEEGPRNAVVKLTGLLDTTDVNLAPALVLSDLTNNDKGARLVGFRINRVEYSISDPLVLALSWNALNPQQAFVLAGRGRMGRCDYPGFSPGQSQLGYNGSLNLVSTGFKAGVPAGYTVVLWLVKLYQR